MLTNTRLWKTPSAGSAMSTISGKFISKMGRKSFTDAPPMVAKKAFLQRCNRRPSLHYSASCRAGPKSQEREHRLAEIRFRCTTFRQFGQNGFDETSTRHPMKIQHFMALIVLSLATVPGAPAAVLAG